MSDHLAVFKPRLMIDIVIWSWQDMCKEQGTASGEGAGAGTKARAWGGFDLILCQMI